MGKFNRLSILKRPRAMILFIICLLVAAAVLAAVKNFNGPAQGTITTPLADTSSAAAKAAAYRTYSDRLLSFKYPAKYEIGAVQKSPGYLDTISLIKTGRRDQYAAIALIKETLDSDSGINYRRLHPDIYQTLSRSASAIVFAKPDGREFIGFIEHHGEVISISFSSVAAADFSNDYKTIAESLIWQQ